MKKKILIFGSQGQLGSELLRIFEQKEEVLALDFKDLDVTKRELVFKAVLEFSPEAVFNASAYNKVEQAEAELDLAFAVNTFAPQYIARACNEVKAVFFHVSTDYVFDGSKEFFYENDCPKPLNNYGASKASGEILSLNANPKTYLIRTSAVFGAQPSSQKMNFVDQIVSAAKTGKPLSVVDDQITSPTYAHDLAEKMAEIFYKEPGFGIYHITNQNFCSWFEFAKFILETAGLKANVTAKKSDFSQGGAVRPLRSVLKSSVLETKGIDYLRSWQQAVKGYLKEKYSPL